MQRIILAINFLILMLGLCSSQVWALKDDTNQPLNISSDEQLADFQANKAIFLNNVVAVQGSMVLNADKAEIIRDANDQLEEIRAYGHPAKFKQDQDNGKVIRSQSSVIQYLPKQSLMVLTGKATIWQDNSHVNGERIEYNLNTKQLKATNKNSQGGRVQSTFIPSELKNNNQSK